MPHSNSKNHPPGNSTSREVEFDDDRIRSTRRQSHNTSSKLKLIPRKRMENYDDAVTGDEMDRAALSAQKAVRANRVVERNEGSRTSTSTIDPMAALNHTPVNRAAPTLNRSISSDERDFEIALFQLKQAKLVNDTLKDLVATFPPESILFANGRNFSQWASGLEKIGSGQFMRPNFFTTPCDNRTFEKIGKELILATIHSSHVPDLQNIGTSYEMFDLLKKKCTSISRAGQMKIWNQFVSFTINPNVDSAASIASTFKDMYAEWRSMNVWIHADDFLGFCFQSAVMKSSLVPFKKEFELRVEHLVQEHPRHAVPTFRSLIESYEVCERQHQQAMATNGVRQPSSSTASTSLPASEVDPDPPKYYTIIPPQPNICPLTWPPTQLEENYEFGRPRATRQPASDRSTRLTSSLSAKGKLKQNQSSSEIFC